MNPRSFLLINDQCENALIDLPFHDNKKTWMDEHHSLFLIVEDYMKTAQIKTIENSLLGFIYSFYNTYLTEDLP